MIAQPSQMKGFIPLKKDVLNTVFGSCPVNMSDEDILDAMKSIIFWVVGGIIHRHCSGSHHKL